LQSRYRHLSSSSASAGHGVSSERRDYRRATFRSHERVRADCIRSSHGGLSRPSRGAPRSRSELQEPTTAPGLFFRMEPSRLSSVRGTLLPFPCSLAHAGFYPPVAGVLFLPSRDFPVTFSGPRPSSRLARRLPSSCRD